MFYILLGLAFILGFYFLFIKSNHVLLRGVKEVPKVPGRVPIFGHIFSIGSNFTKLSEISLQHGPIFQIQLGWKRTIVLNNFDVIQKAMKLQGNNFAGRWSNIFTKKLSHDSGIIFKEKESFTSQKQFILSSLKKNGFQKSQTEAVVKREGEKIIKTILSMKNGVINNNSPIISLATINVISDFIFKKEFSIDDQKTLDLIQMIQRATRGGDFVNQIVNIFPIFDYFPDTSMKLYSLFDSGGFVKAFTQTYDFVDPIINDHRKHFQKEFIEGEDLIDDFLIEQSRDSTELDSSFTDWQLKRTITELFIAGFETTSNTLSWSFIVLCKYQQLQQQLFDEISHEIGVDKLPTMSDKKNLHLVSAFMDETMRFSSILPVAIPHRSFDDCVIGNYFIPGNSIILVNLHACHTDPKLWDKPHDFHINHFLTQDNKYRPRQELIPFGTGKRSCMGESLARVEYFILLVMILQKFHLEFAKEPTEDVMKGMSGFLNSSKECDLKFTERC